MLHITLYAMHARKFLFRAVFTANMLLGAAAELLLTTAASKDSVAHVE
jgi:hypothetical protein